MPIYSKQHVQSLFQEIILNTVLGSITISLCKRCYHKNFERVHCSLHQRNLLHLNARKRKENYLRSVKIRKCMK